MTCGAGYFCTVNANLVQGCCPSATPKCTLLNTCIDNTATSTYAASVLAANNVLGWYVYDKKNHVPCSDGH